MSSRTAPAFGARTVLLVAVIVILVGCGSAEANTADGAGTSALDGASEPRPAQTTTDDGLSTSSSAGVNSQDESVTKPSIAVDPAVTAPAETGPETMAVTPGAGVLEAQGFSDFFGLRVGLVANRASVIDGRSVIDVVAATDAVDLRAIFAPEHGLRADAGAGELVADGVDPVTGLPVFSLYGDTRAPTPDSLTDIDVLFYDLQDVGARFYTYTATMGLAMQAAAAAGIPFVVLDRPNPIGDRTGGAVRAEDQVSFVSQYPVPALHGMTSGELALAVRGERWLDGLDSLDLRVVEMSGWQPDLLWSDTGLPWVPPSPGLPTVDTALAYPATVLFEATTLSYGRGTDHPFQQIGAPWLDGATLARTLSAANLPGVRFEPVTFTPLADERASTPQYDGQMVSGVRVIVTDGRAVDQVAVGVHLLAAVIDQANAANAANADSRTDGGEPITVIDRPSFLALLAGTTAVGDGLLAGTDPAVIVASWDDDLARFDQVRDRYRLYRR